MSIFTDEIKDYMLKNYVGVGPSGMAERLNNIYGTSYTRNQIKTFYQNNHLNSGLTGRFEKGIVSKHKGKKQTDYMSAEAIERSKATRFRKGNSPKNILPVGAKVLRDDGYIQIKIAEPNEWQLEHRFVWEQHNGKLPNNCRIIHKNGIRSDNDIDNLMLATMSESAVMTLRHFRSSNPKITETGLAVAKLYVLANKRRKELYGKRKSNE